MKIILPFLMVLVFTLSSQATDFSAKLNIKTGDSQLDLHLSNINSKASTPAGATIVRTELKEGYKLSDNQLSFLSKKGYTLAEIQYLALLAKQSGKPLNDVAALHSKGIGWGILAKRLGVRPDALRKAIVAEKKAEKSIHKEDGRKSIMPKMEKQQEKAPRQNFQQRQMMQPQRTEGRGMGGGRGRGR